MLFHKLPLLQAWKECQRDCWGKWIDEQIVNTYLCSKYRSTASGRRPPRSNRTKTHASSYDGPNQFISRHWSLIVFMKRFILFNGFAYFSSVIIFDLIMRHWIDLATILKGIPWTERRTWFYHFLCCFVECNSLRVFVLITVLGLFLAKAINLHLIVLPFKRKPRNVNSSMAISITSLTY